MTRLTALGDAYERDQDTHCADRLALPVVEYRNHVRDQHCEQREGQWCVGNRPDLQYRALTPVASQLVEFCTLLRHGCETF
jgi:hypothetical protein